jgi:hypothetical protein
MVIIRVIHVSDGAIIGTNFKASASYVRIESYQVERESNKPHGAGSFLNNISYCLFIKSRN